MALPRLSLDRPFTYVLPEDADAGTGSLVSVPFHGRTVKGWILGPAAQPPPGRLLPVRRVLSPVRFFDHSMLRLLRWVSERYLAPLATVIERSHPPRVASEERDTEAGAAVWERSGRGGPSGSAALPFEPGRATWVRPLPGEEAGDAVRAIEACLRAGRRAIVLVPEADPLPFTARAVLERFGPRAARFMGGDGRRRYRAWLEIGAGRFDVVVGTRPAVFAPLPGLGAVWISREVHPGHREDRSPYYHVREVATARARFENAACVLASLSPSVETAAAVSTGATSAIRPPRAAEREAAPLVETVPPRGEDRSARLATLLKRAGSGALIVSRTGYGVARVCRSCGDPAACASCRGPIVLERGAFRCRVCEAPGRCARCGGDSFGVERAGTERVAEWAGRISPVPVELVDGRRAEAGRVRSAAPVAPATPAAPAAPGPGRLVVGTAASVKDVGPIRIELVAILDPDRALVRPGVHAGEQALATWMEAAAWAGPRSAGGRVLGQTRRPGHPALQSLIRWDPLPFLLHEAEQRSRAGFAPGHPVFRIEGTVDVEAALRAGPVETVVASAAGTGTVCLVAVRPEDLAEFRQAVLRHAEAGTVRRVEAEPQV